MTEMQMTQHLPNLCIKPAWKAVDADCDCDEDNDSFVSFRFPYDGEIWPCGEGVQHHTWSFSGARFIQQLPLLQITPRCPGVAAHQVSTVMSTLKRRNLKTHLAVHDKNDLLLQKKAPHRSIVAVI